MNHPFSTRPGQRPFRRAILTSAILPALLAVSAFGVDWTGPISLDTASLPEEVNVIGNSVVTLSGAATSITETSITFAPTAATETLQVDGVGYTLRSLSTILATANGKTITVSGSADFAPGALSTGPTSGTATVTGIQFIKNGGAGALILDNATNTLANTTLKTFNGVLSIVGGGPNLNPISSLTTVIEIGSASVTGSPVLRLSSTGGDMAFVNKFRVFNNGTIDHTSATNDSLGSVADVHPISANRTLTVNVATGGGLTINGTIASQANPNNPSGNVVKTGAGSTLTFPGVLNVVNLNVAEGRVSVPGQFRTTNNPVIAPGATLSLTNASTSLPNSLPTTITVSTGTLEGVPGSFINSPTVQSTLALAGGTLNLGTGTVSPGLVAHLYSTGWGAAQTAFGGPLNPNNTYTNYANYFAGLPNAGIVTTTSAGGVTELRFGDAGNTAMYAVIAPSYTRTDDIVSRFIGKIIITTPGTYTFGTSSDDGSMLYIDGGTVVSNNNSQGNTRRSGTVALAAGLHDIDIGYYEGVGSNGLTVDYSGPDTTDTPTTVPNSVLLPLESTVPAFLNPVTVSQNSVINTSAGASVPSVTISAAGKVLNVNGYRFDMGAVTLGGTGTHTINAGTLYGQVIARSIADAGAAVSIVNSGPGMLVLESGTSPQLQNAASTVSSGELGVVLGGAGGSPTGAAAVNTEGRSLTLSSKGGNQTYSPAGVSFTTGGSINAARIGNGVAGTTATPIRTTLTQALTLNPATTLQLASQDNYILNVAGISGGGSISILRGSVETAGPVNLTGTGQITVTNGKLATQAGASAGAISVTNGTLTNTGTLTSASSLNVTGSTLTSSGNVSAVGALTVDTSTLTSSAALSAATVSLTNSTVTAAGALTSAGAVTLTNSTLNANGGGNVSSISLTGGALVNAGALATGVGGITLAAEASKLASLELNGGSITGGPITAAGGVVRARTGITNSAVGATFTQVDREGLLGRFLGTGGESVPSLYPGNTAAGILAAGTLPAVEKERTTAISFGPLYGADAAISTLFGGVNTAQRFTLGFFGKFTAPSTDTYQFQTGIVDDTAGIWLDLDGNGIFQTAGAAGNELVAAGVCCGDGPVGSVNLTAGRTYKVGIAVEDTGGGSSLEARIGLPGGGLVAIDSSSQTGLFTYEVVNQLNVDAGAELNIKSIDGAVAVLVAGKLGLTGVNSSNTFNSLTIASGGLVTLGGASPAPAEASLEAVAVPEPGTLSLLIFGALGCLQRRRATR